MKHICKGGVKTHYSIQYMFFLHHDVSQLFKEVMLDLNGLRVLLVQPVIFSLNISVVYMSYVKLSQAHHDLD
jgi:hypothetical protein